MSLNESKPEPQRLPDTAQETEASQASATGREPPQSQNDTAPPTRSRMDWPTVVFGAGPAVLLSLPAVFGILQGFVGAVDSGWRGIAFFLFGLSWWAGVVSLWIIARNRPTIDKRTAVGLVLGLIGAILYIALSATEGRPQVRLNAFSCILLVGPIWISLFHLKRFRWSMGTAEAARQSRTARPPPSEKSTRRVGLALKILLFVQVFAGCLFGATMLSGSAGLGGLMIMVMGLPFEFGVAAFAVWAYIRRRPCRPWAVVVFFAPAIVSNLLQLAVKIFEEPTVTAACGRASPWVPLAAILLFPHTAGRMVPRLLRRRGACIAYLVVQGVMILLWGLIILGLRISIERGVAGDMQSGGLFVTLAIVGVACAILSILGGVTGLLFGYVGLFRQREECFIGLSIAHMAVSIPLLTIGVLWLRWCTLLLTNPG